MEGRVLVIQETTRRTGEHREWTLAWTGQLVSDGLGGVCETGQGPHLFHHGGERVERDVLSCASVS